MYNEHVEGESMHHPNIDRIKSKTRHHLTHSRLKVHLDIDSDTYYDVLDNQHTPYNQVMFLLLSSRNDPSQEIISAWTRLNYRIIAFLPESKEASYQTLETYMGHYLSQLSKLSKEIHFVFSSMFFKHPIYLTQNHDFQSFNQLIFMNHHRTFVCMISNYLMIFSKEMVSLLHNIVVHTSLFAMKMNAGDST